jgi:hypothetical protein
MRMMRGIAGALVWLVASLLGLVAVLLCLTVVLLPVGLPLLLLDRRLFGLAIKLMAPRAMAHPGKELRKSVSRSADPLTEKGRKAKRAASKLAADDPLRSGRKRLRKAERRARKRLRR